MSKASKRKGADGEEVPGTDLIKKARWERHKWTSFHDTILFETALEVNAVQKTFGTILKRWADVAHKLSQNELFSDWGELKIDMLRRRYEKIFRDELKEMRSLGIDLNVHTGGLTRIQELVRQAKGALEENIDEKQKKKERERLRIRADDEGSKVIIKETVERVLARNSVSFDGIPFDLAMTGERTNELITALKALHSVDDKEIEAKGKVVVDIFDLQNKQIQHLSKQNTLLLTIVCNLLRKDLG